VDALLSDAWLGALGSEALPTIDEASIAVARALVRERGAALGLGVIVVESLALAASELVANQLRHGRRGQFAVRAVARGGVPGLELCAADLGPGIADPRLALAGPGPSERSLGAGLSGARRMVHEMDLDVRWGQGTLVLARAFAEPARAIDRDPSISTSRCGDTSSRNSFTLNWSLRAKAFQSTCRRSSPGSYPR